ncbi:MAG: helix-turn-helix domain-containing protein, partial [Myxococcales bacterium]|nr:helix-turn-helix domain-containing protein [Myxococcales bacterium]
PPVPVEAAPQIARPPMPAIGPKTEYTGPLLRQIREALGIELREITERSKIGMSYLQALESEQYAKLPAIVYVRGFLSEYARILGLEARRVIETYLERYRSVRAGTASEEAEEE